MESQTDRNRRIAGVVIRFELQSVMRSFLNAGGLVWN